MRVLSNFHVENGEFTAIYLRDPKVDRKRREQSDEFYKVSPDTPYLILI
jgi:hypothetical protein